jgi:hypothetical protein
VRASYQPSSSAINIVPPREITAMTFSLLRAEENVPEGRRPSSLSIVGVNGTLRSCGSFACVAG